MLERDKSQTSDSMTDTIRQDTEAGTKPVVKSSESLNGPNTSIDSGIHDVIIKQEPMDDYEDQNAVGTNLVTNSIENIEVKKEQSEDTNTVIERNSDVVTDKSTNKQLENTTENNLTAENTEDRGKLEDHEEAASLQLDSNNVDQVNLTEKKVGSNELAEGLGSGRDPKPGVVEEISDVNKIVTVNVKSAEESSDTVIVEGTGCMMEYRSTEKVITIDDTSDSSPDSSDSETDAVHGKEKKAENTEVQINRIISNAREASPERERRVKMNRHGFEDVRTKGELLPEELPPLEELTITVDESVVMVEVGSINSIVGILVVIQSNENVSALDDETILFVEGHKVLGQVFEVFGPVRTPWYSVRFNEADNIDAKGLQVGMPVFCAPREKSFTKFVFVDSLKRVKGSDASWEDNNEPPEKHLDYSDDESERRAKAKRRNRKFGENQVEDVDEGENMVQKKNSRNRNRNKQHRDDQQPPGRAWNPFQGNQNDNTANIPPRFGPRPQNNGRNGQPAGPGQRWPRANFNRPQSRFGGPPNFQNRPRMGQHQGQQPFAGRNTPCHNNWRQPANTNFQNNQQNYEFVAQPLVSGPPQGGSSFSLQSPPPPMSGSGFVANTGHVGQNCQPAPVNVDMSRPPPQFQFGSQVGSQPQSNNTNSWIRPPVNMNKQNAPFIPDAGNQYVSVGNQPMNNQFMNPGNQMCNQGFTAFQGNQPNNAASRNLTENNASQMSHVNFSSASNIQQNPFNQPPPNSSVGFRQQSGEVHGQDGGQFQNMRSYEQNTANGSQSNFTQIQTSGFISQSGFPSRSEKGVISAPNSTPVYGNNMQSGPGNSMAYSVQQSGFSGQGHNVGNSTMQNISGHNNPNNIQNKQISGNENFVPGQMLRSSTQQGFPHNNNAQSFGTSNQFAAAPGFQSNFVQNQTAGQTGGTPMTGNMFMPVGNNMGYNQVQNLGHSVQPGVVTDQRFIQNNTSG